MTTQPWQLKTPVEAIVFDCDGTLSSLEGVDELAKNNGVHEKVATMTAAAMGVTGLTPEIYQARLDLIYPRREQVLALGEHYFKHQVPDAREVIETLQRLGKTIYVVSAGLYPAISIFAALLKIPQKNIFAVDISFDEKGNYLDYDRHSPLVHNHGKREVVEQIKQLHREVLHIGDGLNDYATHDIVTRFIGYGGIYPRENLAACCDYYIHSPSLAPLLPLALTQGEFEKLMPQELALYQKGIMLYPV